MRRDSQDNEDIGYRLTYLDYILLVRLFISHQEGFSKRPLADHLHFLILIHGDNSCVYLLQISVTTVYPRYLTHYCA